VWEVWGVRDAVARRFGGDLGSAEVKVHEIEVELWNGYEPNSYQFCERVYILARPSF
jgi:hypothetical protein